MGSIVPLGRIILRADHKTLPFLRSPIHSLDNIDEFLLVGDREVDFVVISRTEIDLNVFVPIHRQCQTNYILHAISANREVGPRGFYLGSACALLTAKRT